MNEKKRCPYCGEEIMATAKKCIHCGEWLVKDARIPARQEPKVAEKKHDNDHEDLYGCLAVIGVILLWIGIPIAIVLFIAHATIPSNEKHVTEIQEDVRSCVREEAEEKGNAFISGFGTLMSMVVESGATDEVIDKAFERNNTIVYDKSWFWSTCKIVNSSHPSGTTVSFGIFGFVIPFVSWEDIRMMSDDAKQSILNSATDSSSGDDESYSSGSYSDDNTSSNHHAYDNNNSATDESQSSSNVSSEDEGTESNQNDDGNEITDENN